MGKENRAEGHDSHDDNYSRRPCLQLRGQVHSAARVFAVFARLCALLAILQNAIQ
jgi:hypothetical protein